MRARKYVAGWQSVRVLLGSWVILLLRLHHLLGRGRVALLLIAGVRLGLFLRGLFVCRFR